MTRAITTTTIRAIALLALPLALPLSACAPDRVVTGSTYPVDYRERHPIVLAHAPQTLDLFVSPAGLDGRQREDLWAFAADYRRYGEGFITAELPSGPKAGAASRWAITAVRAALADAGVPSTRVTITSYPVADPQLAAPIHLSFSRLQAKVGSRCGLWPQDLGISDVKFNANNDPYWNLGCAMQSNVASQVADPVDLVRGRTEGRVDTVRRMETIEKLRQGQDPSTSWRANDSHINKTLN
jgi:pilus assembly protein CpaD